MTCRGCGQPLGKLRGRLVGWADSPTGVPFYVCGACGAELSLSPSFRDFVGEAALVEDIEPSWEPYDNAPVDWTADTRSGAFLERLQALIGFTDHPIGAAVTLLAERSMWN